jgi:hypothetical protein
LVPVRADVMELSVSIAQEGQHEPVVLYEKQIIEGRVRYSACLELGIQPQFKDWVLLGAPGEDPVEWMVRRHVATHELTELDRIKLVVGLVPYYTEIAGATTTKLNKDTGLSHHKVRTVMWLLDANKLGPVLAGEKDLRQAGREIGVVSEKREIALGKSYGAGDKFDEATQPIVRYLKAWKRKGYEFRHLNPKEATRRISLIESLVEELQATLPDLKQRSVTATLSAPPERRTK